MNMPRRSRTIGLIAGSGDLPHLIANAARAQGDRVFSIAIKGFAKPEDFQAPSQALGIAEIAKLLKLLHEKSCSHVVMAGYVKRPDFSALKPDLASLKYLPKVINAARSGDDGLLRFFVNLFESEGFGVLAPQEMCAELLMPEGHLAGPPISEYVQKDIQKAVDIARISGRYDIGQGAVVCDGLVLAVEAQEGTDAMLERVGALDKDIRGQFDNKRGVLAKCLKPDQDIRVDLPTIGPGTVERAANAGLAGIVLEAHQAFVVRKSEVVSLANELGVFIYGIPQSKKE